MEGASPAPVVDRKNERNERRSSSTRRRLVRRLRQRGREGHDSLQMRLEQTVLRRSKKRNKLTLHAVTDQTGRPFHDTVRGRPTSVQALGWRAVPETRPKLYCGTFSQHLRIPLGKFLENGPDGLPVQCLQKYWRYRHQLPSRS